MYHQLILDKDDSGSTEEQQLEDVLRLWKDTTEEHNKNPDDKTEMENTFKYQGC